MRISVYSVYSVVHRKVLGGGLQLALKALVIEEAMAEALECRILDLVAELLAHAFRLGRAVEAAWTVPARALEALLDGLDDLGVWIERHFHGRSQPR